MKPYRLIVCEKTGRWASALRRVLPRTAGGETEAMRVFETRSWPECRADLATWPASFVILEATSATALDTAERLAWLGAEFRSARCAVVGDWSVRHWEWLLREAGAVDVVLRLPNLRQTAKLIERHWKSVPEIELPLRDSIWSRLPWPPVVRTRDRVAADVLTNL